MSGKNTLNGAPLSCDHVILSWSCDSSLVIMWPLSCLTPLLWSCDPTLVIVWLLLWLCDSSLVIMWPHSCDCVTPLLWLCDSSLVIMWPSLVIMWPSLVIILKLWAEDEFIVQLTLHRHCVVGEENFAPDWCTTAWARRRIVYSASVAKEAQFFPLLTSPPPSICTHSPLMWKRCRDEAL